MMIPERPSLERRVLAALDGQSGGGTRIPVVLGGCGTGRTSLLLRLRDLIGRTSSQYLDVEAVATTPERFFRSMREASPFPAHYAHVAGAEPGARESFDATLAFLDTARAPATGRRRSCSMNSSSCGPSRASPACAQSCATWWARWPPAATASC